MLVETLGSDPGSDALRFEEVLGAAFEEGLATDAVIAQSDKERKAIWEIRDDVLELFNLGPIITYDISVTLDRMEDFVSDVQGQMDARKNPVCVIFGHLGDCNLHMILGASDPADFDYDQLQGILYGTVERFDGSVSAEHGIGVLKRDQLPMSRSSDELRLMMGMKNMLDPNNILNPNKIFTAEDVSAA